MAGYDLVGQAPACSVHVGCPDRLPELLLTTRSPATPRSAEDTVVPAHGKAVVKTGLSIGIPHGTYARVAPRSGLAVKNFIDTGAGVVDEDYRGEVGVVLFNHGDADFQGAPTHRARGGRERVRGGRGCRAVKVRARACSRLCACGHAKARRVSRACARAPHPRPNTHGAVKCGDRVAQLILERISTPEVVEVDSLDDTQRGAGGYGSTGVSA